MISRRRDAPAPCRPFRHDTERAREPAGLEAAPEFGAIATARRPLLVEKRQMRVQSTLPRLEDIGPLSAHSMPYELPAMTGSISRFAKLAPGRPPSARPR